MFSYKINDELELAVPRLTDGEALYDLIDRNRDNLSYYLPWVDHVHDVQA
ncbi:GNAT family N-acetyltransferase, partial [Lactobacillus delbrueckii subsp. bulgaricus]|nr:GNAT family N-acetyltransferase [Lactobacillus delbrueckii subsp. bulgaricus]